MEFETLCASISEQFKYPSQIDKLDGPKVTNKKTSPKAVPKSVKNKLGYSIDIEKSATQKKELVMNSTTLADLALFSFEDVCATSADSVNALNADKYIKNIVGFVRYGSSQSLMKDTFKDGDSGIPVGAKSQANGVNGIKAKTTKKSKAITNSTNTEKSRPKGATAPKSTNAVKTENKKRGRQSLKVETKVNGNSETKVTGSKRKNAPKEDASKPVKLPKQVDNAAKAKTNGRSTVKPPPKTMKMSFGAVRAKK